MSTTPGSEDKTAQCDPPKPLLNAAIQVSPADPTSPTQTMADDAATTSYGPYKLGKKLGEGGFGSVYEAEQEYPVKRRVALKLIKLGMDTQEVIARFEAERQALALMEHPNIARVLDVGTSTAGRPYFVMELVQGEPISSYCDTHKLSIAERLKLFNQVCEAVQHAHTKGVIHRDLKPSNVLISTQHDQPLAKVIDFGIAKATSGHLTDRGLLTNQVQMIGTPHYMSPEQAQGSADIDTRADIYSLGALLYELLTDATPFESTSLRKKQYTEILHIICEVEPPRPSTRLAQSDTTLSDVASKRRIEPRRLIKTVRGELDWVVMKALEKDRTRRYETANALALDVRRYLSGQPLLAAPPSKVYRIGKFVRRHRLGVGAGLMVAASLIVGVVGFAWQARIAQQQARIAQQRAAELQQVSKFQADMLKQVDPTAAGKLLVEDVRAKHVEALTKAGVPEAERAVRSESFAREWKQVNATDAARDLIDRTILNPAIAAIDQQFKAQPLVDATLRQALASRYVDMGLYDTALPLQERALATRRRVLGEEHPDTLASIANLGLLLQLQGKLDEAEPYLREAVEKGRLILGGEHPDTVNSIHWLGQLLQAQGKLEEAEPYSREALDKRRRALGGDDPDTLTSLNSMGELLRVQGKLSEAEPYHREALATRRRVLGEEHPATLASINNLGILLQMQGKLSEAEPYARESVEKGRRVQGEDHPDTLTSINNLGVLLHAQGKLGEAEPYYREAVEKRRRVQGSEHADTLASINNLGMLLQTQGKLGDAEPYLREALETKRRVLGAEHPDTVVSIGNLGALLQAQGKLSEAEPYLREALEKSRRVMGEEDRRTLIATYSLASLREAQGKHAEAVDMLGPTQAAMRKAFTGSNAFRLARLLTIMGKARTGLGGFPEAESTLLEAHGILAVTPGPSPKHTRDCIQAIVDLYTAWHAAEPGKGYDAKAVEWKQKLTEPGAAGSAPVASKPSI